jgi:hypothetical protein
MATNAEIEMRWMNAWNDLYEIIKGRYAVQCQLPDSSVVDVEQCKSWLQDAVYEGDLVSVEVSWVGYRKGVTVKRWSEKKAEENR